MINLTNKINEAGFTSNYVFKEGLPSQEIVDYAAAEPDSLIVLGTHGKGHFTDMVLGSTAYAIIQLVESNCLLVPMPLDKEVVS